MADPEGEGRDGLFEEGDRTALGLVVLTARWTKREARSIATYRYRLRLSALLVRSFGKCFTSTCTKPRSYSLKLLCDLGSDQPAGGP